MTNRTKTILGICATIVYLLVAGMTTSHAASHCQATWQSDHICRGGMWPNTAGAVWPIYWPAHVGASVGTGSVLP